MAQIVECEGKRSAVRTGKTGVEQLCAAAEAQMLQTIDVPGNDGFPRLADQPVAKERFGSRPRLLRRQAPKRIPPFPFSKRPNAEGKRETASGEQKANIARGTFTSDRQTRGKRSKPIRSGPNPSLMGAPPPPLTPSRVTMRRGGFGRLEKSQRPTPSFKILCVAGWPLSEDTPARRSHTINKKGRTQLRPAPSRHPIS